MLNRMQEEVGLEMLESVPGSIVDAATQYVGTMNEILSLRRDHEQLPGPFLVQLLDSPLLRPECLVRVGLSHRVLHEISPM
jgi:hypothetical protein